MYKTTRCISLQLVEFLQDMHDFGRDHLGINMSDSLQGETPLTAACLNGQKDLVMFLLRRGADPYLVNTRGFPPLLCAVKAGQWEVIDQILHAGIPIEQADKHGRTALMIAASEGHLGVLEMLLSKGENNNSLVTMSNLYV